MESTKAQYNTLENYLSGWSLTICITRACMAWSTALIVYSCFKWQMTAQALWSYSKTVDNCVEGAGISGKYLNVLCLSAWSEIKALKPDQLGMFCSSSSSQPRLQLESSRRSCHRMSGFKAEAVANQHQNGWADCWTEVLCQVTHGSPWLFQSSLLLLLLCTCSWQF